MKCARAATLLVILGSIPVSMSAAVQNLVVNPSFENPAAPGLFETYLAGSPILQNWTIVEGSVDIVTNACWHSAADGTRALDLNGDSVGRISQTIGNYLPGQLYMLMFYVSGNPDVVNGSKYASAYNLTGGIGTDDFMVQTRASDWNNFRWKRVMIEFYAPTDGSPFTLWFAGDPNSGARGPVLDRISITAEETPTPEPATFALLGLGVAGLAVFRRRRS